MQSPCSAPDFPTETLHMTRSLQQARRGFTLVEVLVVISILAIIMGIGVGAYFLIMGGQKQDASKTTTAKIDGLLLRKMKAIRDKIKDDVRNNRPGTGYPELKTAGLTSEAAEAVLLYCRMKNEMPMTYAEALSPTSIPFTTLPPLPVRSEFKGLTGTPPLHVQSAVCLYRALAPMGLDGLEQQLDASEAGAEKYFKDNGGKPIIFNRLAFGGDQNELNAAPFSKGYDPFFPKKLPNGTYQSLAATSEIATINAVWEIVTPIDPAFPVGNANRYLALSYWGIPKPTTAPAPGNTGYPVRTFHTACAISWGQEGSDVTTPSSLYGNGNIVSYRLREEGAKGD